MSTDTTAIKIIQTKCPIVLCLTNTVTQGWVANVLLAAGASPIMTAEADEIADLMDLADTVYINMGTLGDDFHRCLAALLPLAQNARKPIVFDPVGAGASTIRRHLAQQILPHVTVVRGNASEILALGNSATRPAGVDSCDAVTDTLPVAQALSAQSGMVVITSGPVDYIVLGDRSSCHADGHPMMTQITGMGCALTALIAAGCAVMVDDFAASVACVGYYNACGTAAAAVASGPGSFQGAFLDALSQLKET